MCKSSRLAILSLFVIINYANTVDSKTILSGLAKKEDVEKLLSNKLKPKEALPTVLFENYKPHGRLEFPVGLLHAEIKDGRLTYGTQFFGAPPSGKQLFFCPKSNIIGTPGNCLVPEKFKESEVLQCKHEINPMMEKIAGDMYCGPEGIGTLLRFGYKICPAKSIDNSPFEPYTYTSERIYIFFICYEKSIKKIIYAKYRTNLAHLYSEELLASERQIEFQPSTEPFDDIDSDYYTSLDTATTKYTQYELQTLVPSKMIPMATMRKLTYHYVNLALQHKKLVPLWNEINDHIRNDTERTFALPREIYTGVVNLPKDRILVPKDENQMPNIWITAIFDHYINPHRGVMIMMNNFFASDEKPYIDEFCGKNYCVDSLKKKFTDIGGEVRCCQINQETMKFFNWKGNFWAYGKVLLIPHLTYDELMHEN